MNKSTLVYQKVYTLNPIAPKGFWSLAQNILQNQNTNLLSNFDTINIIKNISTSILNKSPILGVLTNDFNFPKELFKIFSLFKNHKLTPEKIKQQLEFITIHQEDQMRFSLIVECFQKYEEFLRNNNFEDSTSLISKATNHINKTKTNFNIEILFKEHLTPLQIEFIQALEKSGSILSYKTPKNAQNTQKNIDFYQFDSIKSEAEFICKDITNKIAQGEKYSNCAIIIRKKEHQKIFAEELKKAKIPINGDFSNKNIHNFKYQITTYLELFGLLKKIQIPYFSFIPNKNTTPSIAEYETTMQEIDCYLEDFLEETIDFRAKDKILERKEATNSSLYQVLFSDKLPLSNESTKKLITEIEHIKKLYSFYIENNFEKIIETIATKSPQDDEIFVNFIKKTTSKLNITKQILQKNFQKDLDSITIKELLEGTIEQEEQTNAIHLENLYTSKTFKNLYIPCFSEEIYPQKPKSIYFISPASNEAISTIFKFSNEKYHAKIINTPDILQQQEELLLNHKIHSTKGQCLLSYHNYNKKPLAPSIYFSNLLKELNTTKKEITQTQQPLPTYKSIETENNFFLENEKLYLSPSAISNFLDCKRKYLYANLLEVQTQSTFKASYGSIVHAILQCFSKSLEKNKHSLINYTEILFNATTNQESALEAGFEQWQIKLIQETDELSLVEMKENFIDAIDALENTGWFELLPEKIETEIAFYFELPDIKNVIFNGKIDAIYDFDNQAQIIDYKTGNKKKPLSYYFSEEGINKSKESEKSSTKYNYQIPIYYLASQNAENLKIFKEKLTKIGLNYITSNQQVEYDLIEKSQAEQFKEMIIENLKETVIDKIRNSKDFEPNKEAFKCQNCPYKFLCDEGNND